MNGTIATEPPPWDEPFARAVVLRVVDRKRRMFAAFHDIDEDDLLSEGITAAWRAWPRFDPTKSQASTFVYICAARRIIDLYRQRVGQGRRDTHIAVPNNAYMPDPNKTPRHEPSDAEWLTVTLRAIRRNFERYGIPDMTIEADGITVNRTQAACLLALKARIGLEDDTFVAHLGERPGLVEVLGMAEAPGVELVAEVGKAFPRVGFAL